ncbi:response regulator transcription factor [Daejeonella oryzae]|uniref:response regulator transcription factor n=1 Tax=Daejeonella oryzae TaxID=1122943 RepID=UPI0003FE4A30|nr:helix-turn-helix transcriptional regulator [Daejeonella oryzae]
MKIAAIKHRHSMVDFKPAFIDHNEASKFQLLTRREKEIIRLIADGHTSMNISNGLFISIHTVNNHRKNIYKKLQTNNIAILIRFAVKFNLV